MRTICRGCVQQTVLTLDSVYSKLNNNEQWVFITSHKFIEELPLKNIKFIYDYDWENVNYDFRETMYFKFVNDSIVFSKIIANNKDVHSVINSTPFLKNALTAQLRYKSVKNLLRC